LIRRMCDADETALGALYDRWMRSLYSLVVHLLKDPDEAEDVVEETFWQAWRKASSYEPSRGAVSTWLLTIGRRRALDRLRAKARRREDSLTREGRVLADMPSTAAVAASIGVHHCRNAAGARQSRPGCVASGASLSRGHNQHTGQHKAGSCGERSARRRNGEPRCEDHSAVEQERDANGAHVLESFVERLDIRGLHDASTEAGNDLSSLACN